MTDFNLSAFIISSTSFNCFLDFKALSNIEDVLEKMESGIKNLQNEELQVSRAIEGYAKELREYRDWAVSFPVN